MFDNEINKKCFLIGSLRVVCFQHLFDAFYSDSEEECILRIKKIQEAKEGILITCNSLGLEIDASVILPKLIEEIKKTDESGKNIGRFFSNFVNSSALEDEIRKHIYDSYGGNAAFSYELSQFLALTRFFASGISKHNIERVPQDRKTLISEEINSCGEFIKFFGLFIKDEINIIKEVIPNLLDDLLILSEKIRPEKEKYSQVELKQWADEIFDLTEPILNRLVSHYPKIADRLKRTQELTKELKVCKIGTKQWKEYENICLNILRYLFIPPFRKVKIQVRSEGNNERRDAVIPNNQHSGFWQQVRNEFDCKHIVVEFKNGKSGNSKNALNQLRIYLSKPTVGRFGLLFLREKPSKALLQAQRDAYEQSKILILILDDERLINLMKSRAYLGSIDDFMSNEKFEFEINY